MYCGGNSCRLARSQWTGISNATQLLQEEASKASPLLKATLKQLWYLLSQSTNAATHQDLLKSSTLVSDLLEVLASVAAAPELASSEASERRTFLIEVLGLCFSLFDMFTVGRKKKGDSAEAGKQPKDKEAGGGDAAQDGAPAADPAASSSGVAAPEPPVVDESWKATLVPEDSAAFFLSSEQVCSVHS